MMALELGDLSFTYYYNGKVKGTRRWVSVYTEREDLDLDAIYQKLREGYDGKFLLDTRYSFKKKKDRDAQPLENARNFWYCNAQGGDCNIIVEGCEVVRSVVNIEDIAVLENKPSQDMKDFLEIEGIEIVCSSPMFSSKCMPMVPFRCMTGVFKGHTAGIRVSQNGVYDLELSKTLASLLEDCYIVENAYVFEMQDEPISFTRPCFYHHPSTEWLDTDNFIVDFKDGRVTANDLKLLVLLRPVCEESIVWALKRILPNLLEGKEAEILYF